MTEEIKSVPRPARKFKLVPPNDPRVKGRDTCRIPCDATCKLPQHHRGDCVPTESRPTAKWEFNEVVTEVLEEVLSEDEFHAAVDRIMKAAEAYAASSSLLPVPDETELNYLRLKVRDADKVMEAIDQAVHKHLLSSRSDIADARQNYGEPYTSSSVASLPVGESTREKCDMCSQPLDAQVEFLNRELANFRRNAAFAAQSRWISVEEKLPEDRKAVLVAHENLGNWVWVATRVSGQWKQSHNHDIEFNTGEITHWQPLPKPPELGLGESREPLPSDVPK